VRARAVTADGRPAWRTPVRVLAGKRSERRARRCERRGTPRERPVVELHGLLSGAVVWVRARAVTVDGPSEWLAPARTLVG